MRKLLFILLLLLPSISMGEQNKIHLRKDSDDYELQRNEIGTNYSAEVVSNSIIKIIAEKNTTFNVKILDASLSTILYQGVTVDGVFHITDGNLSAGHYVLSIEDHGVVYVGEFEILSN